jgi:hypothetical protein
MEQKFKDSRDSEQFGMSGAEEVGNAIHRAGARDKNIAIP